VKINNIDSFSNLIHDFTKKCDLTDSIIKSTNCIAQLLDEVLINTKDFDYKTFINILSQLIKANPESYDYKNIIKDINNYNLSNINISLKFITIFFHLLNQIELMEISRINSKRGNKATKLNPRPDSIFDAIKKISESGYTYEEALEYINRLDIQPTFTAHPTEARRRLIMKKQKLIINLIERYIFSDLGKNEKDDAYREIKHQLNVLILSDEIRAKKVTVLDEVQFGIYFCLDSIWNAVPNIYRDFKKAFDIYYGRTPEISKFLNFRTWIGGDRDGNPFVTAKITKEAITLKKEAVFNKYFVSLENLNEELSISSRKVNIPSELKLSIKNDLLNLNIDDIDKSKFKYEPFRLKLICINKKLSQALQSIKNGTPIIYSSKLFINDLKIIKNSLSILNKESIFSTKLENLIVQASSFGYSLMTLDIRQHSNVHEIAINEILSKSSNKIDYTNLSETDKCKVLSNIIQSGNKFVNNDLEYSNSTLELLDTFQVILNENKIDKTTIKSYIISMTHSASDIIEVLYLAYETGLYNENNGEIEFNLDIVPLLETINDLENTEEILEKMLSNSLINNHVKSRGNFQEIMLGYSDSNKDGGIVMANWSLQVAQRKINKIFNSYGINFRLFHGRGGTISRGGGRANKAILAQPINNGRIRMTEQGEVISYRYSMESIAKRHLEQITNAALIGMISTDNNNNNFNFFNIISENSMNIYRKEVFSKSCWEFFVSCSPIKFISNLPIASRPVFRNKNIIQSEVSFEDLRAIPWVFSWVQNRTNITGWFGMGTALEVEFQKQDGLKKIKSFYDKSIFFQLLLNNISFEMAKCRLDISKYYTELNINNKFFNKIDIEFKKMENAYFKITGNKSFLNSKPIIEKTIQFRNPFTDFLNLVQIDLLNRFSTKKGKEEEIQNSIFLSINGIASAMQSTG
tara:strand:+ start:1886 stop:4651 length:2766 start_codon:yes stop_codon:yes gene_type:complete